MNKEIVNAFDPIVLCGPPGVGKSTLILLAKERGIEAYDFEEHGSSRDERTRAAKEIASRIESGLVLFGAADVDPHELGVAVRTVLILPNEEEYIAREKHRDNEYPHKEGQSPLEVYTQFSSRADEYDLVITDIASPEHILASILDHFTIST